MPRRVLLTDETVVVANIPNLKLAMILLKRANESKAAEVLGFELVSKNGKHRLVSHSKAVREALASNPMNFIMTLSDEELRQLKTDDE